MFNEYVDLFVQYKKADFMQRFFLMERIKSTIYLLSRDNSLDNNQKKYIDESYQEMIAA